ncbi:hypothetical protein GCM10011415_11780 [Salipiger pallidus]|uniref:Uncharacterized protein n=1 Tax=Salipiger pallidus TaxID=1775170 RepID=A0A8J2ZI75_9RHOB|nr:hypothetical protein [Salipiger pallidus]GGG66611.1 hypothetical protein GCM10011415_11780 [Salipiger pallidus]
MPKIRVILSKQADPALDEAAIIKRLKEFYATLQDKRQFSAGIPQEGLFAPRSCLGNPRFRWGAFTASCPMIGSAIPVSGARVFIEFG